jgi:hypothetical protein
MRRPELRSALLVSTDLPCVCVCVMLVTVFHMELKVE